MKNNDVIQLDVNLNDQVGSKEFIKELSDTVDGFIDNSLFGNDAVVEKNNSQLISDAHTDINYVQIKGENTNIVLESVLKSSMSLKIGFEKDKIESTPEDMKDLIEIIANLDSVDLIKNISINNQADVNLTKGITDFVTNKKATDNVSKQKSSSTRQKLS